MLGLCDFIARGAYGGLIRWPAMFPSQNPSGRKRTDRNRFHPNRIPRKEFAMIPCEVNTSLRTFLFFLFLCTLITLQSSCEANTPQPQPATLLPSSAPNTSVPQDQAVQGTSTESAVIIPVTALENLAITSCPDWDLNKMYEYGEYMYGCFCAGCHGRQGQGVPVTNHLPR